jgi:hypothetical protein
LAALFFAGRLVSVSLAFAGGTIAAVRLDLGIGVSRLLHRFATRVARPRRPIHKNRLARHLHGSATALADRSQGE